MPVGSSLRSRAIHLLRSRPQREDRKDRGIQREQHVAGDVGLQEERAEGVGAKLRRANRDEQVDRVQRAENHQRKSRLAIGELGDVEEMTDVIRERAVALPGIELACLEQPRRVLAATPLGLRFFPDERASERRRERRVPQTPAADIRLHAY